jgi:hypothetical protein
MQRTQAFRRVRCYIAMLGLLTNRPIGKQEVSPGSVHRPPVIAGEHTAPFFLRGRMVAGNDRTVPGWRIEKPSKTRCL